jgi:glycosyltransferase involved in cell wall biosynthesis
MTPVTCTIVARNYLAQARVLARSFTEQHPGTRLRVLVFDDLDGVVDPDREPFDVLRPSDLPMPTRTFHEMAACYEVVELATALKPTLLMALLESSGGDPVVYLDPDILVLAPFAELSELVREHPIVLTPHTTVPMSRDGLKPTEFDILASGTWNLGFLGVGHGAEPFLSWWAQRLRLDSLVDHAGMRFTDQRWVDLAPAYFDVHPLRDTTFNVAYWNADHRRVEWDGERYSVDGRPLRFFHFSGFDPMRPQVLSKHFGERPRVPLSAAPAIARLCRLYSSLLEAEGLEAACATPYGWATLPDGTNVTTDIRRVVHSALAGAAEHPDSERPPDPFDPKTAEAFVDWLASPDPTNPQAPAIPRLLWRIYLRRPDLQAAFPLAGSVAANAFRTWAWNFGRHEEPLPKRFLATAFGRTWPRQEDPKWAGPEKLLPGYLVTGYLRAELGIGEAARRALDVMASAGIPHGSRSFDLTRSRKDHPDDVRAACRCDLNTNVLWINPDQLAFFIRSVGRAFFEGRYTVGAWAWETESLPMSAAQMSDVVDEIWAPSMFSRHAIEASVDKPVHVFAHPIVVPEVDPAATRGSLGMPDGFVFLFVFDFFSTIARKNPIGLIEAFSRAFAPDEGPTLVLKSINGGHAPRQLEEVRLAMADRADIVHVEDYISPQRCATMILKADCYVSLHRSEGFGLTMADAMALGTPVIATGYSGNLEFMDERTAYLVPFEPTTIGADGELYPEEGVWAEPELDVAAELMRRVYERPGEARRVAGEARRTVLTEHGHARAVRFLTERFAEIQHALGDGFESGVVEAVATALSKPLTT